MASESSRVWLHLERAPPDGVAGAALVATRCEKRRVLTTPHIAVADQVATTKGGQGWRQARWQWWRRGRVEDSSNAKNAPHEVGRHFVHLVRRQPARPHHNFGHRKVRVHGAVVAVIYAQRDRAAASSCGADTDIVDELQMGPSVAAAHDDPVGGWVNLAVTRCHPATVAVQRDTGTGGIGAPPVSMAVEPVAAGALKDHLL